MLLHLWGVNLLCLFCFMRKYLDILGAPKECQVILVQKCWFLSNGLSFSLSNSWNNYLEGWEFFYFKFGMMLLLWWLNYHVFDVADDTRVYVPMGFKGKFFCCYLYMIICGKCSSGVVVVCWDREGRKGKDQLNSRQGDWNDMTS